MRAEMAAPMARSRSLLACWSICSVAFVGIQGWSGSGSRGCPTHFGAVACLTWFGWQGR
jgi:hypothetical protein